MAKLNGQEIVVIEEDKENGINYVELVDGTKKWINVSDIDAEEKTETIVTKKTKK